MEATVNSAIKKGYFQQVRFLIQFGHSVNARDEERRTPLMNCALVQEKRWGVGLARMLLEKGAVMAYRDRRGMNALHYACIYDKRDLVQVLLNSPDFDITQGDLMGNTALHYAARKGNTQVVTLLVRAINKYSLKIDKANRKGVTALMEAWKSGQESSAQVLIEEGHADQTLQELVEHKSAQDFEREFRDRQEHERQTNSMRSNKYGRFVQRRTRPVSASAVASMSSMASASSRLKSCRVRPRSAILLERRRNPHVTEEEPDNVDLLEVIEKEKTAGKIYKSASNNDLRNKPEYILNISPIECFVNDTQYQAPIQASTAPGGTENQPPLASWKSEVKHMYSSFEFQFTRSYRMAAKPRESDGLDDIRIGSPNPSDCDSMRDQASQERANKKAGRKIAVKAALSLSVDSKSQRKGSAKSVARKISTSSNSSLKAQQSSMDTSSCESVNSVMRGGKNAKRTYSSGSDIRDDLSDVCVHEKPSKPRSRKISPSSMDDHGTNTDQSKRGVARVLSIPLVKEPVGNDSLDAIRE